MLDAAGGAAGRNFLTPAIFEVAKRRVAESRGTLEPFRFLHNLLSSQPMCFNLFGPLADHTADATPLVRALAGEDVVRVRSVFLEWAPEPAAEYLADRTAFDAAIEYERPDGGLVLLGIETKLTDSFSQKIYDGERYRRWMRGPTSPFREEKARDLASSEYNQLWRNHLLAVAARDRAGSPYVETRSVVIHHPLDVACTSIVAKYRELLCADDRTFHAWTLDSVVDRFASVATSAQKPWLDAFRMRYLDLALSDAARQGKGPS